MNEEVGVQGKAEVLTRDQYVEYWEANPGLTPMPKEMREDLMPLSIERQCPILEPSTKAFDSKYFLEKSQNDNLIQKTPGKQKIEETKREKIISNDLVQYTSENKSAIFEQINEFPEPFGCDPDGVNMAP